MTAGESVVHRATTDPVAGLDDNDRVAGMTERSGRSEAGQTGTDDRDIGGPLRSGGSSATTRRHRNAGCRCATEQATTGEGQVWHGSSL
jgi:hypothetical protein